MNPEGQSLPRSVFASLCAFALAAGMVLPMLSAIPSYAEEASEPLAETETIETGNTAEVVDAVTPPTEAINNGSDEGTAPLSGADEETQPSVNDATETYTVTFGTNPSQSVKQGESATAPTMPDTTYSINGKTVPATFVGWYKTTSVESFIPTEFKGTDFFEQDLISADKAIQTMFVNDRQQANCIR